MLVIVIVTVIVEAGRRREWCGLMWMMKMKQVRIGSC